MEDILIGKIVTCFGIKGEIKVYNYSDKDRFNSLNHIYIDGVEYKILKARTDNDTVILKLDGICDRNTAETFVNKECYIKKEDLRELDKDSFYFFDLKGLKVISNDKEIGVVTDVIDYTPQANLEIKMENGKKFFLPFVKAFILEVNLEAKYIKVNLIPGFVDDAIEV